MILLSFDLYWPYIYWSIQNIQQSNWEVEVENYVNANNEDFR